LVDLILAASGASEALSLFEAIRTDEGSIDERYFENLPAIPRGSLDQTVNAGTAIAGRHRTYLHYVDTASSHSAAAAVELAGHHIIILFRA
jgi:hypothetical protein